MCQVTTVQISNNQVRDSRSYISKRKHASGQKHHDTNITSQAAGQSWSKTSIRLRTRVVSHGDFLVLCLRRLLLEQGHRPPHNEQEEHGVETVGDGEQEADVFLVDVTAHDADVGGVDS